MASDMFLKLTTIAGESTDSAFSEWIECESFSHGVTQPARGSASAGSGSGGERCDHDNFGFQKFVDVASPKLFLACCKGERIDEARFVICRAGGKQKQEYMEYKMSKVVIASVRISGSAEAMVPTEQISLSYAKIEVIYTSTDHQTGKPKGKVKTHWDLTKDRGG